MDLALGATVFAVVFVAELPDKTALASLVLGSRYRPAWVFAGVATAFAVTTVLAVTAGSLLGLLPHRAVDIVVAVLFAVGAVVLLRGRRDDEHQASRAASAGFWRVAGMSFAVVAVAEFGDLTQVVTASLTARYHSPVVVGVAAVLALWAVGGLAIAGGRGLLRVVPLRWLNRAAALVMLAMAALAAVAAAA